MSDYHLILRKALPGDATAIARVQVDSWRTTYREILPEEHLAKLSYQERERLWSRVIGDPSQYTWVAEESGRIVGFANGGRNRGQETEYAGELYAVYLIEAFQKQGVGRRLTIAIAQELEQAEIRSMIVWVLKKNPACEFYRKLGGVPAAAKAIVIGGATHEEVAFGWSDIGSFSR